MSEPFYELTDAMDPSGTKQQVQVGYDGDTLFIKPSGYGDFCSSKGEGSPVIVERFNGVLRIVIWGDINQEDPTHIISLEGAKENKAEWLNNNNLGATT